MERSMRVSKGLQFEIQKKLNFFELDMSLDIKNETVVLQGMSGSGKTTLLNCISGIMIPDKGYIQIGDRIVYSEKEKINIPIRDRKVGYIFQNYALFPTMNIERNLCFGIKKKDAKGMDYMQMLVKRFGIDHLLDKYPAEISGGEKQRVALVRTLASNPDILLMDEPFSALDEELRESLYQEFISFQKEWQMSILLVTHNKREAEILGDRILFLKHGKVVDKKENDKKNSNLM